MTEPMTPTPSPAGAPASAPAALSASAATRLPMDPGPARVLVVEDEPKLAALLGDYLRAAGHEPDWVADGREVMAAFQARSHDLILLDLMLPGVDGLTLCRELRAVSAVPILMLTARADEADRLAGLELGADDYIPKNPFSPREVMARVKAALRRARATQEAVAAAAEGVTSSAASLHGARGADEPSSSMSSAGIGLTADLRTGDANASPTPGASVGPHGATAATPLTASHDGLRIDEAGWSATWRGQPLDLTPIEFRLLHILASQPGRVYARMQLLDLLHVDGREVTDRAVDSHIKNLRRKLERAGAGSDRIRSIYGVGYRFDA